jgi:ribulose 1,5-bisphosphate synthetase/thiazole synthase
MSKKKLATVALLTCLAVGGGVWGGMKFLKKDWTDRQAEFVEALSVRFQKSGAPSKAVADKAATCIADVIIPAIEAKKCSAEGENVLKAVDACVQADPDLQIALMLEVPLCIQESM